MRALCIALCAGVLLASSFTARAQNSKPPAPPSKTLPDAPAQKEADAEGELQKALASAGNDSAALVRNLKDYLRKFPDAPKKASVYRALVEACQQTRDDTCALEYAERLIGVRPDDSQMMLLAVNLLQQQGDDSSLTRASGYVTRVLDRVEKALPDEKPPGESPAEWQDGQEQLRTALYYVRGRVENSQHNYDAAVKDLQTSFSIRPKRPRRKGAWRNRGDPARFCNGLIEEYALRAFVLPENGPAGAVDRLDVHAGSLETSGGQVHGSDQRKLGEAILEAYDRISFTLRSGRQAEGANARNKKRKGVSGFFRASSG